MLPPIYHTQRFTLQAYRPEDENRFVEMTLDQESVRFMGGANGIEAEERALFQKVLQIYEKPQEERWFWIWGVYENNRLCAHLELKETEHTASDELEVVYMVHPDARRKGLMTEILDFAKQEQSTWRRRIIATVSPKNQASLQLLQKWGVAKKEMLKDKETGDEYLKLTLTSNA